MRLNREWHGGHRHGQILATEAFLGSLFWLRRGIAGRHRDRCAVGGRPHGRGAAACRDAIGRKRKLLRLRTTATPSYPCSPARAPRHNRMKRPCARSWKSAANRGESWRERCWTNSRGPRRAIEPIRQPPIVGRRRNLPGRCGGWQPRPPKRARRHLPNRQCRSRRSFDSRCLGSSLHRPLCRPAASQPVFCAGPWNSGKR